MPEAASPWHTVPRIKSRTLRWWLLALGSWLALGCDPNPSGPTAVPPAPRDTSGTPPKSRPQNPLINRD
jgi:hypothetical protein